MEVSCFCSLYIFYIISWLYMLVPLTIAKKKCLYISDVLSCLVQYYLMNYTILLYIYVILLSIQTFLFNYFYFCSYDILAAAILVIFPPFLYQQLKRNNICWDCMKRYQCSVFYQPSSCQVSQFCRPSLFLYILIPEYLLVSPPPHQEK